MILTVKLCLEIEFNCVQKLNGIKHVLCIFLVFDFRTQINPIIVFNPVQFAEQLGT